MIKLPIIVTTRGAMSKPINQTFNKAELEQAVKQLLHMSKQQGATAAEAGISMNVGFSVTARMGDVESIEHNRDKGADITVYFGQRKGSASTTDLTEIALQQSVEKACSIAKYTEEDPCSGLAEKELLAFDYPKLDLYHPWSITPEQAIELALECENLGRTADKRISNSEGATVNTQDSYDVYANSHGFMGSFASSAHTINCALIASDGHAMERDYDYSVARDSHDLQKVSKIAQSVVQRTVRRLGAKKIATQSCPVIFVPELARGLIGNLIGAISGGNLYRRASFLLDQLDKQIFPEFINIIEQPHLLKGLGSAPFDAEGVATKQKDLIAKGILKTYLLGSYSARKLGMKSTGNAGGVHNVLVKDTGQNFNDLLKQMHKGLVVTELMGQGINLVTGDYSRGAFGFWVENGEIQYPVHEITIAGNLKDMFAQIVAIGNDIDHRGNIQSGSIAIEKMMIAGE
jgi:PmbA protein